MADYNLTQYQGFASTQHGSILILVDIMVITWSYLHAITRIYWLEYHLMGVYILSNDFKS